MTENESLFERVRHVIYDEANVDMDKVKMETVLDSELGLDSLDLVQLIMALEDEFDVQIPDEQAEKCETVKDVVDLMEELS